ncbi:MAG: PAS domain-containing sensor histidine kinase [Bacteroidota bacterium]
MEQQSNKIQLFQYLEQVFSDLEQQKIALDESAIVAITDIKGDITYVNKKFCEISKYSESELLGQNHRIINSGYHKPEFFKELWQTIGSGKVWRGEIKNKAKDGSYYWVSTTIVPYLNEKGKPYQFAAIRFDITGQKAGEEALKQQKMALDESAIVAITDIKGDITYVNDKFCEISKYSKEELIGKNHRIINSGYHPPEFFKELWQTIGSGKVWRGDIKNKAKDGSYYWVSTTLVPYLNEKGKPYQFVAIRFDVTKQKLLEIDLKGRSQQLEDFCFIVSHNLRAPLSNLLLLSSMIEQSTTFEEQKMLADKLSKPVNILNETFNELVESLQVRQDVDIEKEHLKFKDCFDKTKELLCAGMLEGDIDITCDFSEAPEILYPKKYLLSYMHNLISNSIKYRSNDRKLIIKVKTLVKNSATVLTVSDNGIGIDMKNNGSKLFGLRKTFHGNKDAKGFGLFITRTQVEAMGGIISAESQLDVGTTFSIQFTKNN